MNVFGVYKKILCLKKIKKCLGVNEKHQFIIPAVILVAVVGIVAAYSFIQAQTTGWIRPQAQGNPSLYTDGLAQINGGALLNTAGAITGLRVENGSGNPVLLVQSSGNVTVSGILNATTLQENGSAVQIRVSESCPAGSSIRVINNNGTVTCETDDTSSGGGISSLSAGAGISLSSNPIINSGTISVDSTVCRTDGTNCQMQKGSVNNVNELAYFSATNQISSTRYMSWNNSSNYLQIGSSLPPTNYVRLYASQGSNGADAIAIYGHNNNTAVNNYSYYGVYGRSDASGSTIPYGGIGVYGLANASSGTNIGVYGKTNSSSGYAGYFEGKVKVTGNLDATSIGSDSIRLIPNATIPSCSATEKGKLWFNPSSSNPGQYDHMYACAWYNNSYVWNTIF